MPWYVVYVWSGKEKAVGEALREAFSRAGMAEVLEEVVVPPEKIIEVVFSPEKHVSRRFYSGYILVRLAEEAEGIFEVLRNVEGVVGIMGDGKPRPLSEEEARKLLEQITVEEIKPKPRYQFMPGDRVRITEGPFANFIGVVDEVKPDKGKVRVLVSIFGRETPVEIEFAQVQKI
ncbi:transcription termination/antitermination protein NusG [Thermosulfurimonas sp. F29]|uniref:transcription termination/antitermination protein NusG n=1 Tax=Thermosulfurimonas sp. F29 TaxID=2867247 RepID=UPI0021058675|nr:transcription termination/antitermination protein NusG [Thermosulfurimonas sp. F29]